MTEKRINIQTKRVKRNNKNSGYILMSKDYINKDVLVMTIEELEFIIGRKLKYVNIVEYENK